MPKGHNCRVPVACGAGQPPLWLGILTSETQGGNIAGFPAKKKKKMSCWCLGSRCRPRQRSVPLDGLADLVLLCCLHFKHHSSYKCQLGRIQKRGLAGEPGLTQTGPQTQPAFCWSGQLLLKGQPHLSSPVSLEKGNPVQQGAGLGD